MEKLAREYNRFVFEEAPEQLAEVIFSKYLGKWIVLNHTGNHDTPGVTVVNSKEELAEEFLNVVAFHTLEREGFCEAEILRQVEMINEEIGKVRTLISEYIELTTKLLNEVCTDVIASQYR